MPKKKIRIGFNFGSIASNNLCDAYYGGFSPTNLVYSLESEKRKDFMVKSGKILREGYTTGSCAAAASKAAALMLFERRSINDVQLVLPNGRKLVLSAEDIVMAGDTVSCCIVKDAGDDPDVTDGIKVYAKVNLILVQAAALWL